MGKCLKSESVYSNFRLAYMVYVLVYATVRQTIPSLQPLLMPELWNIIAILGAGSLFLWDVFYFRNTFKTKYILLLVALFALTCISTLLNAKYCLIDNVKAAANMFIQFFVFYVVSKNATKKQIDRDIKTIGYVLSSIWMVAVGISLFLYFFDIYYTDINYIWGDPTVINQGFVRVDDGVTVMRLWGVFVDPNFAAAISIIVICLCIYLIQLTVKKWIKGLLITNIVLQSLYIILSNSRMALLIVLFLAFVGTWYFSLNMIKKFKNGVLAKNIFIREIIAVVIAAVMVSACYTSVIVSKKVLPYIQYHISHSIGGAIDGTDEDISDEIAELDREDISSKDDISNGRLKMWGEGFEVLKRNSLIGVGPRSYHLIASEINSNMKIAEKSIHNSYMELLMGNGVIGFILMLILFALCAKDAIKLRFKSDRSVFKVGVLMLIVLSALAGGMFISSLFYYLSGISVVAFGMLGYATRYIDCMGEEVTNNIF